MSLPKALLSVFLLVLSVKSYGYADSAEALLSLQAKINETITADRKFYSCDSDFGKASFYFQGKDLSKFYSINVAGVTTPKANSNLVSEISTSTRDNVHFQASYEKQFLKKKDYRLPRLATPDYETTHYVFRARLGEKPSITHSYKQGTFGYYQALAKGNCTALSAVEFEAALKQRIGQ